jgi:hypothetical protein
MKHYKIIIACICLALSTFNFQPSLFGSFSNTGIGARVCGMSGAFTGLADDVYALYYNPAGLGRIGRKELAIDYSKLYMG